MSQYRILAMNRYGRGHMLGWCDSTTLTALMRQVDVVRYLARVNRPRLASIGASWPCVTNGLGETVPNAVYLGADLPERYKGRADLLARDWDAIVACPIFNPAIDGWAEILGPYVAEFGRGLLVTMDYFVRGREGIFDAVNVNTRPAGIAFDAVNLGYSTVEVDAPCVPDL